MQCQNCTVFFSPEACVPAALSAASGVSAAWAESVAAGAGAEFSVEAGALPQPARAAARMETPIKILKTFFFITISPFVLFGLFNP